VASAWFLEVEGAALVLGSTQPGVTVGDPALEVVRRRSGGGAVLLRPGSAVWVDVVVPADDSLWTPDVGRAFWWLGEAWVEALTAVGVDGARWHDGPLMRSRWSEQVCFAGLGPGEVTVGGRKVVGMSSRRRRDGALFQCAALLDWDPAELVAVLGLDSEALAELRDAAAGLAVPAPLLQQAFLEALATR
jgi:lipoate-protein ligase A